jgi:hypothetical protein
MPTIAGVGREGTAAKGARLSLRHERGALAPPDPGVFTGCCSVALLTATARGVVARSSLYRPRYASSASPERGIRAFRDLNPGSRLHGVNEYCHNGGTAFARERQPIPGGPRRRSWPFVRPLRKARLAGKTLQGSMIRTLWGPEWARLPFLACAGSTATTGARSSPPTAAAANQIADGDAQPGVHEQHHGPSADP